MNLKIDMRPMEALEIFHKGEKLGVWEGDLIRNEKKRGIFLPALLKDFLLKYGLLNVNRGVNQLWLPDKIDRDTAKVDGEECNILIIGKFHQNLVAVLEDDCRQDDPVLLLDDLPEEDGEEITLVFHKSDYSLEDFLTMMLIESPSVYDNAEYFSTSEQVREVLRGLGDDDREKIEKTISEKTRPGRFLVWNETERSFIAVLLSGADEQVALLKFPPCLAIRELEDLFTREFYENADRCDFEHALRLLLSLIDYWSQVNNADSVLAEKFKLAGRCCQILKRWNEAERYYKQAEQFYKNILTEALDQSASFYEGLGNFYLAREDIFKGQAAYIEADRLSDFAGKNGPRNKGERIMRQGMVMAEATCYDKAIELYDQALAEYQKVPKDCKYDIARCQQLRGEARKKLKAKDKQKQDTEKATAE